MIVAVVLILVFVGVLASTLTQGLWNNALTLINLMLAGLIATNYYEPLADYFDRQEPAWTYVWDFVAIWLLFGVAIFVLRFATDFLSKVKVRFPMPLETAGGIVMAIWVAWIALCFTTATLHTAPLARHFLGGFQETPDSKMLFGLQPDHVWLGWMHRESSTTLARFSGTRTFDPDGTFIIRYSNRRGDYENQMGFLTGGKSAPAEPTP